MNDLNTTQELSILEKQRLANRLSYQRNREKRKKAAREYYYTNQDKCKQSVKRYKRMKIKTDPYYRLVDSMRARLHGSITQQLSGQSQRTFKLIGCSVEELIRHIEEQFKPGMSWDNYGQYGWHIDHIKPCNTFNLNDPTEQRECFHYSNLRPLWAIDNWSRPDDGSDLA
jgi:hypothetical protein